MIGAGIVGANAGELIAEIALAIEMGCDVEDHRIDHSSASNFIGNHCAWPQKYLKARLRIYICRRKRRRRRSAQLSPLQ